LTTAGSGAITANSEAARQIQAAQLGLDLLLIGFAVTVILARYTNLLSRARPEFPWFRPGRQGAYHPAPHVADRIARKTTAKRRRAYLGISSARTLRDKRP
jgi:hypothetical protein